MLLPMLLNIALGSGKLEVDEDARHYRLVSKVFGAVVVLSKIEKEAIYQLTRTPDMPATLAEAVKAAELAPVETPTVVETKVTADEPVALPVVPQRRRPQLSVIQGGAA